MFNDYPIKRVGIYPPLCEVLLLLFDNSRRMVEYAAVAAAAVKNVPVSESIIDRTIFSCIRDDIGHDMRDYCDEMIVRIQIEPQQDLIIFR